MAHIDFIKLATYCQEKYKEKYTSETRRYLGTKFVAITKEGEVMISATPHILEIAEQCLLLHFGSEKTSTGSWSRELIQYINREGAVADSRLDNKFWLDLRYHHPKGYTLQLTYRDNDNVVCLLPAETWENNISKVWCLYSRIKDLDSFAKIKLIADLFLKDEKILALEKQIRDFKFMNYLLELERNQYRSLIDEIKQIINKNQ